MSDGNDTRRAVTDVLNGLVDRWNAGDWQGFADHYHPDGNLTDVLGRFHRGKAEIARQQKVVFHSVYRDSRITLELVALHELARGVVVAHVRSTNRVPVGPLAGERPAMQTFVLTAEAGRWLIRALHNTFVHDLPGAPA